MILDFKKPFLLKKSLCLNQNNVFLNQTNHFKKEFGPFKLVIFQNETFFVT